jgi:hypothetical protein
MRKLFALVALLAVIAASPAWAIDLTSAKAEGLVGEQTNGLIGAVTSSPTPEVTQLIDTVNAGRTKIYKQNAAEQKLGVDQVGAIAGEKLQAATPKGQYIQNAAGKWVKK